MLWGYVYIVIPDNCTTLSFSTQEKSQIFKGRINSFFQKRTSVINLFSSVCKC